MRPTPWILAVLAVSACDPKPDTAATNAGSNTAATDAAPARPDASTTKAAQPETDAPAATPDRLAVGERLPAVQSRGAEDREGCGACPQDGRPKLIVLGSPDAIGRGDTWRDLDAIAGLYGDNGLDAIAIGTAVDGSVLRSAPDPKPVAARFAELQAQQRVVMRAEVAIGLDAIGEVHDDPTVVLVDGAGTIVWRGGVGVDWHALDVAIAPLVAQPAAATP